MCPEEKLKHPNFPCAFFFVVSENNGVAIDGKSRPKDRRYF